MNSFTRGLLGAAHTGIAHTSLQWMLCINNFPLISQFGGVDRAQAWTSERSGLIAALLSLLIVETFQLVNIYLGPITCQMSSREWGYSSKKIVT